MSTKMKQNCVFMVTVEISNLLIISLLWRHDQLQENKIVCFLKARWNFMKISKKVVRLSPAIKVYKYFMRIPEDSKTANA